MRIAVRTGMKRSLATLLLLACSPVADEVPLADKGYGQWVAMPGALPTPHLAIAGLEGGGVFAVGPGGVEELCDGAWRRVEEIPETTYRTVWSRSASQVWIGGDDVLLSRTVGGGWQEMVLLDGEVALETYSVLALTGDAGTEYALVATGGRVLLLLNEGSAWQTPHWLGSGPSPSLPAAASAIPWRGGLLVAGDDELIYCRQSTELGVPMWETVSWRYWAGFGDQPVPRLRTLSGGSDFFVGVGGASLVVYRDLTGELEVSRDQRWDDQRRDGTVAALSPAAFFVAGAPLTLAAPDAISGVTTSPVEACDANGCALERVEPTWQSANIRALWADCRGRVLAAGDGVILERHTGCSPRCP